MLGGAPRTGRKKKLYKEEAAGRNAPGRLKMKCREEYERLANLLAGIVVVATRHVGRFQVLRAFAAHPLVARQLRAPTMARHAAFASGFACFLAGPLVGRALLMSGLATLAGNLALLRAVHRSESAVLFSHTNLLPNCHSTVRPRFRFVGLARDKSLDLLALARESPRVRAS